MDKEFIDGYVKLPYDNNKFIRWIDENELEMIEKKIIHISNEIIADESVDIIKYIEDKLKSETDHYKQQRDSLIKYVEKLREELRMHIQCNDELERVNVFKTKKLNREKINNVDKSNVIFKLQEEINKLRKDNDKYTHLTEHIKNKAIHNPSVSRYIDLVHFIDDLERDTHEG